MNFVSQNKANNVSVADAQAFVDKMRGLGLPFGPLFADETEGMGAEQTAVIALTDIPEGEITPEGKYFLKSYAGGDFHGIAEFIIRMKSAGETMSAFRSVCDEIGVDAELAMLNIPGVGDFIRNAIAK